MAICHQRKKEWTTKENKGKHYQSYNVSVGAAAVGEKACLRMKHH